MPAVLSIWCRMSITGMSKNGLSNQASNKNNHNNHQTTLQSPIKAPVTYYHTKIPDASAQRVVLDKTDGQYDWSKKLQTLINAYDSYRNNFNELLSISPNAIRAVEGLYSDYGQYENVPNSGWSHPAPRSLHQQNALSIPDKIAFGTNIGYVNPTIELLSEKGAKKLAILNDKDGGQNNNFERYANRFNKALLSQLKSYVDLDGMATKTDDISRLAYTQLKSYFDNLEIILDEDKLKEFTGISPDIQLEKEIFVTNRLLPDPMDSSNKNKPVSLWADDDNKIIEGLKKSEQFTYLKKFLLDSPTTLIQDDDGLSHKSEASFLNPYEGLSAATKDMLNIRRDHINDYINTLPHEQRKKVREAFFDDKILGDYKTPTTIYATESATRGALPHTYQPINSDFFKKQRENFTNPLDKFKSESQSILSNMLAK